MVNFAKEAIEVVAAQDPEVAASMTRELERQQHNIELIASENVVSQAVLAAAGSVLTNKYAEGYPGHRYYGGCVYVDEVETLAIERAKALFGAEHANVQPHSGSQANLGAYAAILKPGDTILGMKLAHGGHLTHGAPVSQSGKIYNALSYGVDPETGILDYAEVERLLKEHHPKLLVAGASSYPRIIDFERLGKLAHDNGALFMVDMAHIAGLVAAGEHPSPVPYADIVTTTTHKTLRGPRGGMILCRKEFASAVDKAIFPGNQGGPLMHVVAAKAVCFKECMTDEFRAYQSQIVKNAKALSAALLRGGLNLVSGGTDNHLMMLDLRGTGITGAEREKKLDEVNITANKNAVPNDPEKASVTSGVRIGTPAVTSRGFKEKEMEKIAEFIILAVKDFDANKERIRKEVRELCEAFPLY